MVTQSILSPYAISAMPRNRPAPCGQDTDVGLRLRYNFCGLKVGYYRRSCFKHRMILVSFCPEHLLNLPGEQLPQGNAERSCEVHEFKITNPSTAGLNLCNRVAPNIPSDPLAFRSKSRLRKIPLEPKPPNLRPNNVSSGFHRRARLST